MSRFDNLRILLLQARFADDPMARQELQCFADVCALALEQFVVHDLLDGPPARQTLIACDAVMVGGSGDLNVSKRNLPKFDATLEFFRQIVDRRHPMFASCFGYHCLVSALDGEIIYDPKNTEVGTYELTSTPAAADDPLFKILPQTFMAQQGHKDRARSYPDGIPNLAASSGSPLQALRIPDQPIWATQFHPELTRSTNLERLECYFERYAEVMSAEELQAAREQFHDSPDTPPLLPRFLTLVFG